MSQNREHMSAIGREGGESRAASQTRRGARGSVEETDPSAGREAGTLQRGSRGATEEEEEELEEVES